MHFLVIQNRIWLQMQQGLSVPVKDVRWSHQKAPPLTEIPSTLKIICPTKNKVEDLLPWKPCTIICPYTEAALQMLPKVTSIHLQLLRTAYVKGPRSPSSLWVCVLGRQSEGQKGLTDLGDGLHLTHVQTCLSPPPLTIEKYLESCCKDHSQNKNWFVVLPSATLSCSVRCLKLPVN